MQSPGIVSLIGSIAVAVSYLRARPPGSSILPRVDDSVGRAQFLHASRSITAALWPYTLSSFAHAPWDTCVMPSMLWMLVVWWLDVRHLDQTAEPSTMPHEVAHMLRRGIRMEPSMITALTFGLCGLVGARADTQYTPNIVYALIACVLVVLPHVELSAVDPMMPLISEVQRMVLVHGIATIVTCVCLTRTSTIPVRS